MTTETFKEASPAQKIDADPTAKKLSLRTRLTRGALAASIAAGSIFGLSACADNDSTPGGESTPKPDKSVGQVELGDELAQERAKVLDMCTTGENANEMKQTWDDYFKGKYNVEFSDAVVNSTDYTYISDLAVVNYGTYTYKNIGDLAENCEEVIWLATRNPVEVGNLDAATEILEEYRTSTIPNLYLDSMQSMANNLVPIAEAAEN